MVTVVLDADFLSSFLKIDRLELVREYFQVETLHLPMAVFREVSVTRLLPRLTRIPWLESHEVRSEMLGAATAKGEPGFVELGRGEMEAIALSLHLEPAILLTNDRQAQRSAHAMGISTVNVPAFLLMYKSLGEGAASQVPSLVKALEEKDHFGFPKELRSLLVAGP